MEAAVIEPAKGSRGSRDPSPTFSNSDDRLDVELGVLQRMDGWRIRVGG